MSITSTDADTIRQGMAEFHVEAWGFTIYRTCYYNDDDRWERFLERFKDYAKAELFDSSIFGDTGREVWSQLQWTVYQDPALEGCSKEDIWRYVRQEEVSCHRDT